jgi:hypothetical protein
MSAALICNNKKCNEIGYDRELSFLHVLTWTAFDSTKQMCSGGGLNRLFRAVDEDKQKMASGKVISIGCASLQLVKYHTLSGSTVVHTWTNSLKSSPRCSQFVTRSHHRMIMYMGLSVFGGIMLILLSCGCLQVDNRNNS